MLLDHLMVEGQEVIDSHGKTCRLSDMLAYGVGIRRIIASEFPDNMLSRYRGSESPTPKIEAAKVIDVAGGHQTSKACFITENDGCPHSEGLQGTSGFGKNHIESWQELFRLRGGLAMGVADDLQLDICRLTG